MSNLGHFNSSKTPDWTRSNASPNLNPNNAMQSQLMNQNLNSLNNPGMIQFQQHPQVYQSAMGLQQQNLGLGLQQIAGNTLGAPQIAPNQLFQQVGAVTYPNARNLNSAAFQTSNMSAVPTLQGNTTNTGNKQRVFTGTVTKVHDNFGFVDEDVFFQSTACVKGSNPVVGDRVLVEASYNPSMPFKWNATRIQVIPTTTQTHQLLRHSSKNYAANNIYNAVPPPSDSNGSFNARQNNRAKGVAGGRRERSRDQDHEEEESERKRRREERLRDREKEDKKSPVRRRSRTPKSRRRMRIVPRYMIQVPKIALNIKNADVLEIRRRYTNMYIPSDFFHTNFQWVNAFPPNKPFSLSKPCSFHIMNKEIVEPLTENNAILEPADADYLFSAKVMLMSVPGLEELYHKCCGMTEDEERKDRESEDKDFVHPSRLINFLVGLRGKNETMAIGGPWSESLDGPNPERDPSVLIKTAIRTCKALTSIDLSNCTQWYRFVELYYHRSESNHKGKNVPARVETVVLFLPDVWSCLPTRLEWDNLTLAYHKQLERKLKTDAEPGDEIQLADEKEEEVVSDKLEPTHFSELDPKAMSVGDLRNELKARSTNNKGLKSQLVARLTKLLKAEADKVEDSQAKDAQQESENDNAAEEKKNEAEEKKLDDKEKALLEKRYTLPEQQHLIVHPSKVAKSGKFDCTLMSLSLLLDYRPEDTKEHSFEVSLFAELFNEMLMRDFGFNIYKALYELPDKPKEKEKEEKKKVDEKKRNDDKKKQDDKKQASDKKKEDDKEKKEEKKSSDDGKDEKKDQKDDSKKENNKKSEHKSDESEDDDEGEEEDKEKRKDRDKKKKDRIKLYTKDKQLLLSFIYFDPTHCGYIFDKDVEDLLFTLGLSLSRAQVKKLLGKVIARDSLHYRKLTDKPKEEEPAQSESPSKTNNLQTSALGNSNLLPVFKENDQIDDDSTEKNSPETPVTHDGMVIFQGALVDVSKLIAQLERSDKARFDTETRMVDLKAENSKLQEKYNKSTSSVRHVNSELKDFKEKLRASEESLTRSMAYSKLFQTTLFEIRDKIDPILKTTSAAKEESHAAKKESDREKKHEESKSRWEKDVKTEEMETDEPAERK